MSEQNEIIDSIPAAQPEAPAVPEQGGSEHFTTGPRGTGQVPLPNGNTLVREITPDGMRQDRIVGPPRPSTAMGMEAYLKIGQPESPSETVKKKSGGFLARVLSRKR